MKPILSVVLALMLCLSLFACGKKPEAPPANDPPVTETPPAETPPQEPVTPPVEEPVPADPLPGEQAVPKVVVNTTTSEYLTETGDVTLLQITMSLPSCGSLSQIDNYYQSMKSDLVATYRLNLEDALRQYDAYKASGMDFSAWKMDVSTEITRNDGATLSVLRSVSEEWPEHDVFRYYAETFDVATQGRLLLSDLFQPGVDYLTRLADSGEVDQLNFALSDDSLMLCIEGGYRALPLSDLSDILLPQYITE